MRQMSAVAQDDLLLASSLASRAMFGADGGCSKTHWGTDAPLSVGLSAVVLLVGFLLGGFVFSGFILRVLCAFTFSGVLLVFCFFGCGLWSGDGGVLVLLSRNCLVVAC